MPIVETKSSPKPRGGVEFLLRDPSSKEIFTPEDYTEEHLMIADMVDQFLNHEIMPAWDRLEKLEEGLSEDLLKKMGDLGLLSAHMPESLGGLEMDFISNSLIAEKIGPYGGFSVTYNAHTGIGMLPILYFGTDAQKEKYLPDLMSGVKVACYCLTEPGSGSDALAAKSTARFTDDGKHYLLNGQKMWISNAGFADLFIVFAKIDGEHFTAFILEKGMKGLSLGEEEKKMGIKGSSTRMVFMEDVMVPVENLLGEAGKGHLIAFNVLNIGRYKLGVSCLGGTKDVLSLSIQYANERHQFGKPIASFGAIQHKLARQFTMAYMLESVIYRLAGDIQDQVQYRKELGTDFGLSKLKAAKEFALECSIVKILGSEVLDYCVDEAVQIHGGIGYSEEARIAQAYRDARINRIFEGTNEINRLLISNIIFKKALKGELDIANEAQKAHREINRLSSNKQEIPDSLLPLWQEEIAIGHFKNLLFLVLGELGSLAIEGKIDLKSEQEVLSYVADMVLEIYAAESCFLRIRKKYHREGEIGSVEESLVKSYLHEAQMKMENCALNALSGIMSGETKLNELAAKVRILGQYPLQNGKAMRRVIARYLIDENTCPI